MAARTKATGPAAPVAATAPAAAVASAPAAAEATAPVAPVVAAPVEQTAPAAPAASAVPAAPDAAAAPAALAPAAAAVDGDSVTVIVAENIGGLRNGEKWPAVGEPITLPAAEAADYLAFGYVREDKSAE